MDTRQAFVEELYRQHAPSLRRFCRHFVGGRSEYDDAVEECVQDVFVSAYRCCDQLRTHPNVRAWLYKTCQYRMQDKVKQLRRHYGRTMSEEALRFAPSEENIDRFVEKSSVQEEMERFFSLLSEKDRELLSRRYLSGEPIRDIANALAMNENTVKVTLLRLRRRAKQFFSL